MERYCEYDCKCPECLIVRDCVTLLKHSIEKHRPVNSSRLSAYVLNAMLTNRDVKSSIRTGYIFVDSQEVDHVWVVAHVCDNDLIVELIPYLASFEELQYRDLFELTDNIEISDKRWIAIIKELT